MQEIIVFEMPYDSIFVAGETLRNRQQALPEEGGAQEPRRRVPKILIVDDERRIADTLKEILEMSGFQATVAYDGWDALDAAAQLRPDYLLSDVMMPRMNGVELAIAIRKMCPAARILLFSGQAGTSDLLMEGHRRGFEFELIAKPIHPLKLIEHLKNG